MQLDSASGRCWFDLFDEEELAVAVVDTTLVALSSLTIVPPAASQASLGWDHVLGLGCLFLQESSGFLCFPFLWHFFHRNHDSCSAVTFF